MRKIIWTAVFSLLVFAPAAVTAQPVTVRQACKSDLEQHCAGVQPGEGRLRACVKENFAAFSEPCKAALAKSAAVREACRTDVHQQCPGVRPGAGRILLCVKQHFAALSEPCKEVIGRAAERKVQAH